MPTAALTALDQVLEAEPNHNDAQLMRGLMRLRQGETEAGRSDLVAVYQRTGGYPGLTGPLGRLFAREGNLDELEAQARRLLADPRARDTVSDFVEQWLGLDQVSDRPKDPKAYPEFKDDLKAAALNLMKFFEDESCGQCTPCRNGTEKAVQLMSRKTWDVPLLEELSQVMRDASICGLGQAAPNPLSSILKYFPEELK